MSKVLPDPQLQSLKAMRAGDIAFAQGGTLNIGVQKTVFAQPLVTIPETAVAVPSLGPVATPAGESPVVGKAFADTLSQDALVSVSLLTTNSLVTPDVPATESPTIGVALSTSVV